MTARFVVTLETRPGIDGVRALRRLMKFAGRYLGLKAIDVQEHVITAEAEAMTSPEERRL
jgi:hypothetical protein